MRLSHVLIAGTAFLSFGALAEGTRATPDKHAQAGTSAPAPVHASTAVIKQVQQKLSAAGHDAGSVDGIMSAKTLQALKDFQKAKGIEANGQIDQRTLVALGVKSGVGATPSSAPETSVGSSTTQQGSRAAGSSKPQ